MSRRNCWISSRCRCAEQTGANFVNNEARRVNADQFTYRVDFTESPTIRAGSSGTASPTSSATTRSRSRTWGSTPTPTCTRACSPTRARSAPTRSTTCGWAELPVQRPHLAARQHRQRGQGARHQSAQRQPALLGRAEHRHHRTLRPRRRERRAVHQLRHDDSDRRQLLVDASASTRSSSAASCAGCVYNQIGGVVTRGRFAFDGRYTQNPLAPAAGATAARRWPTSSSATSTAPRDRSALRSPTSARTTSRSTSRTTGR